ncbi:MAG TPA: AAA family ATPase, partial [Actinoplanes sp.]|nr:AAA family ATPase [Actinoplanes sp.]
ASRDAVEPAPEHTVCFGFWHRNKQLAKRSERALPFEPWADIRPNYSAANAVALDTLMNTDPGLLEGRLALLYGPPGTGKTTLIRSLADAWRSWCTPEYVLDADELLGDPNYLMRVLLDAENDDESDDRAKRWRLLVLEDCGEFLRVDAKQAMGQGLSRLLNLTDGLLGQGRNALIAITTNEELASLHPAVVRPGRCLASIEVSRLPYAEAVAWLGTSAGIGPDGATLAELYALKTGAQPVTVPASAPAATGLYL